VLRALVCWVVLLPVSSSLLSSLRLPMPSSPPVLVFLLLLGPAPRLPSFLRGRLPLVLLALVRLKVLFLLGCLWRIFSFAPPPADLFLFLFLVGSSSPISPAFSGFFDPSVAFVWLLFLRSRSSSCWFSSWFFPFSVLYPGSVPRASVCSVACLLKGRVGLLPA
jgi:hypothetical protein